MSIYRTSYERDGYLTESLAGEMRVNQRANPFVPALVEHLADAVIFADREGLIQVWNAGAQAVFGYR